MDIFDFNKSSDISNWEIVNDVVMGGRSTADFSLSTEGIAVFEGQVSLENNGGFSSVRFRFPTKHIEDYKTLVMRIKGDGKNYQIRTKTSEIDRHSYVYEFQTSGDWEVLEIPFSEMMSKFRGRTLAMPNYPGKEIEELAFLIGNGKSESFKLEIDFLTLK